MADCSKGPVSTMPGSTHTLPEGATCDTHEERPAFKRVQGETDSWGCEFVDMCQECYTSFVNRDRTEEQTGTCEWCHTHATDLRKRRDADEGMAGRLYDVCGACVKRDNERLQAELDDEPEFIYDDRDCEGY